MSDDVNYGYQELITVPIGVHSALSTAISGALSPDLFITTEVTISRAALRNQQSSGANMLLKRRHLPHVAISYSLIGQLSDDYAGLNTAVVAPIWPIWYDIVASSGVTVTAGVPQYGWEYAYLANVNGVGECIRVVDSRSTGLTLESAPSIGSLVGGRVYPAYRGVITNVKSNREGEHGKLTTLEITAI